jgi:hypothetical protein
MGNDEEELVRLLLIASVRLAEIRGPIWSSYPSGTALAGFTLYRRSQIARGTIESDQARELWGIFAPTSDWDDVVGDARLGDAIFTLLDKLYGPRIEKGV